MATFARLSAQAFILYETYDHPAYLNTTPKMINFGDVPENNFLKLLDSYFGFYRSQSTTNDQKLQSHALGYLLTSSYIDLKDKVSQPLSKERQASLLSKFTVHNPKTKEALARLASDDRFQTSRKLDRVIPAFSKEDINQRITQSVKIKNWNNKDLENLVLENKTIASLILEGNKIQITNMQENKVAKTTTVEFTVGDVSATKTFGDAQGSKILEGLLKHKLLTNVRETFRSVLSKEIDAMILDGEITDPIQKSAIKALGNALVDEEDLLGDFFINATKDKGAIANRIWAILAAKVPGITSQMETIINYLTELLDQSYKLRNEIFGPDSLSLVWALSDVIKRELKSNK